MLGFPLLTALVLVPFAGALITALVPRSRPELARVAGYATSVAVAGLAVPMLTQFRTGPDAGVYQLKIGRAHV